ncbi:MAG: polymer-forming cytoskeletal protein [Gemmatimonadetes bacterium]|nr:polymer-forming cytoskeletal protein [Gemmatimonadota bacterium]
MHRYRSVHAQPPKRGRFAAGAGWILLLCSSAASAQQAEIVSSKMEVSSNAASLLLELEGGEVLSISFAGGTATLNGDPLGQYVPGGAGDRAWRDLLGSIYSHSGTPLVRELTRWRPDPELGDDDLAILARVDEALDAALAPVLAGEALSVEVQDPPAPAAAVAEADPRGLVGRGPDFLRGLAVATEGVEIAEGQLRVGEDYTVPAGAVIDGGVLVVDGNLDVRGHVRGTVVVLDGFLTLAAGSRVDGDIRLMNSGFEDEGSTVDGRWVSVAEELRRQEERRRALVRDEIRREESRARNSRQSQRGSMFMYRVRAVADMLLVVTVTFLVLGFLTFLLTVFSGHRVRAVVGEVARNPLGSTLAGFAGAYAVLPVFILVCAALAVTIIGIPVLFIWIPLFPLALGLACLAGFVGVAENIGRWVLKHDLSWLRWVDDSNTYFVRLFGIGLFLLPLVFGTIVAQMPFVDWVGEVVGVAGLIGWAAALLVGFGAVIVTRGGSRGVQWSGGVEDDAFGMSEWPDDPDPSPSRASRSADDPPTGGSAGEERVK